MLSHHICREKKPVEVEVNIFLENIVQTTTTTTKSFVILLLPFIIEYYFGINLNLS